MMVIGEKIKELREKKGWSKKKLADKLMTSYNNVRHWEVGRNEPSIFFCILLADAFDVTLDELCCRDKNRTDMLCRGADGKICKETII